MAAVVARALALPTTVALATALATPTAVVLATAVASGPRLSGFRVLELGEGVFASRICT